MAVVPEKVVWILGSGFSRPLGGPLLKELLHRNAFEDAKAKYHPTELKDCGEASYVFNCGGPAVLEPSHQLQTFLGAPFWADAEDFLEEVDAAYTDPKSLARAKLVRILSNAGRLASNDDIRLVNDALANLRAGALRLVALQCRGFTENADLSLEKWDPYLHWSRSVASNDGDSVVTFNYDTVTTKLELYAFDPETASVKGTRKVYKLHGSVSWRRQELNDGIVTFADDPNLDLLACDAAEIGIAPPGPSKKQFTNKYLDVIWEKALGKVSEADAIVFLGYRFPPSDSEARRRILAAIANNRQPHLSMHIVLGPNRNDVDVVRLGALLSYVAETNGRRSDEHTAATAGVGRGANAYQVRVHPLWCQDFLSIWDRRLIQFQVH